MRGIQVIAFKGKGGSGKSTAARCLVDRHGALRTSFAEPLKAMMKTLLRCQGADEILMERMVNGDLKEVPTAYLSGQAPRAAMQLLGTEFGRALHPNLWVNIWRDKAASINRSGFKVVVDDCRFENEAEAVRSLGGHVVEVISPSEAEAIVGLAGHASEAQDFDPDITVINRKTGIGNLCEALDEALGVLASGDDYAEAA